MHRRRLSCSNESTLSCINRELCSIVYVSIIRHHPLSFDCDIVRSLQVTRARPSRSKRAFCPLCSLRFRRYVGCSHVTVRLVCSLPARGKTRCAANKRSISESRWGRVESKRARRSPESPQPPCRRQSIQLSLPATAHPPALPPKLPSPSPTHRPAQRPPPASHPRPAPSTGSTPARSATSATPRLHAPWRSAAASPRSRPRVTSTPRTRRSTSSTRTSRTRPVVEAAARARRVRGAAANAYLGTRCFLRRALRIYYMQTVRAMMCSLPCG